MRTPMHVQCHRFLVFTSVTQNLLTQSKVPPKSVTRNVRRHRTMIPATYTWASYSIYTLTLCVLRSLRLLLHGRSSGKAVSMASPSRRLGHRRMLLATTLVFTSLLYTLSASAPFRLDDADIAAKLALFIPGKYDIQQSDLPLARPPAPSIEGWEFCDWHCLESYTVKTGERHQSPGVYEIEAV